MAYTAIDNPSAHFHIQLWTGDDNTDRLITNDANAGDFRPDLLILKNRTSVSSYGTFDSSRLASSESTLMIRTNTNGVEEDKVDRFGGFETDGFTVDGADDDTNADGDTFIAWQWKANGGTTSSVSGTGTSAGSTKAGTYQANTTAGFSIVTFSTGADDNGDHRIQHGLGAVPHFIITKERDGTYDWYTYHHKGTDDNDYLRLNLSNAISDAGARNVFDGSDFTSTYFEMDNNNIVNDSKTYVAYCFTEIQGYSKFGSYTGNGNADGPFLYTGFKPAWLLFKETNSTTSWLSLDNKRNPFNGGTPIYLSQDDTSADNTGSDAPIDFLSNGFKLRTNSGIRNGDGDTYIYMAFAEQPFVTSGGVPCTAR